MERIARRLAGAAFIVALGLSARAGADNSADSDRANLLFKKGKVAFNDGKYADALRIYSEAWRLKQSPDIAANLAQTESELGQHRAAAEHFAFALAHLLPSSTDEQKYALAEGLEQEKREIGSLRVTLEPSDASITVDDQPVTLPVSGDLYLEAGAHRVTVTREGYQPSSQTVRLSKGASQVLWIKLLEVGAKPAADAHVGAGPAHDGAVPPNLDQSSSRSIVPAIVGGGLVVAGATVGVVFLLSANSAQKDADEIAGSLGGSNACGAGTPFEASCARLHDKNVDIDRARTIEVVGFAVAGAAALGTAAYLLWPQSASTAEARSRPSLLPTFAVGPGGSSLGLSGRF